MFQRIKKFMVGYQNSSPNALCCKFCIYSNQIINSIHCDLHHFNMCDEGVCRSFKMWDGSIDLFADMGELW